MNHSVLEQYDQIFRVLVENQQDANSCISIKDQQGNYHFANSNFIHLMGRHHSSDIISHQDKELTNNKALLKKIKELDDYVFEEKKSLLVSETIDPNTSPHLRKTVDGNMIPIWTGDTEKPAMILGVFKPRIEILCLDYQAICTLPLKQINHCLQHRKYPVKIDKLSVELTRRDVQILILLIRGYHAGKIAATLFLQQTTVESYLQNIKNKLGVYTKRELICTALEKNLLGQILL